MLQKYNLSPSRLILEVTESTALKNLDRSIELLNTFNRAGITVSIDDFGTGYSNLLMLSVLPAKELKIDKSFVSSMLENEKSWRSEAEIQAKIMGIWQVMQECIQNGLHNEGILPGGLNIKRRAKKIHQQLLQKKNSNLMVIGRVPCNESLKPYSIGL